MADGERLSALLSAWEEAHRRGVDTPPDELARDCPELIPQLRQRIEDRREEELSAGVTEHADGTGPGGPARGPEGLPRIPGYEVLAELGRGGRGVVYRARQLSLGREVALKVIKEGLDGPDALAQFRREAEAVARLQHPHVVQVFDSGEHAGRPYFSMELAKGGSLEDRLRAGPQAPRQAAELVETLARALAVVHARGVVHRDLKPANVLLTEDGTPKVVDFGLAKRLEGEATLTPSGAIVGTVGYMAPEQAAGETRNVGPAADVYSLGAILYEALAGRPPFPWTNLLDTIRAVRFEEPTPPARLRRGVPHDLETVCLKCLEKDPARRYAGARELAEDLRRFLEGRPVLARRRRWYEKAWRAARAHPFLSAAAALLLVAAGSAPVAIERLDPERPRKQAKALLARGEPYVFAGHGGLPGPFRWVLGDAGLPRANPADGCVTVETLDLGLLEVVDDPGCERYRLLVELRHEDAAGDSFVGLYFGYRERRTNKGIRQGSFHTLTFADAGTWANAVRDKAGKPVSRVMLHAHCFSERPGGPYAPFGPVGRGKDFPPANPVARPGPWRTLAVEVRPEGARAFWAPEGGALEAVEDAPKPRLEGPLRSRRRMEAELVEVPADFRPRSGVGLYLCRGKAVFRRVVLEPLPAGESAR